MAKMKTGYAQVEKPTSRVEEMTEALVNALPLKLRNEIMASHLDFPDGLQQGSSLAVFHSGETANS